MKTYRFLLIADVLLSMMSRPEQERWFPPQLPFIEKLGRLLRCDWNQKRLLAWFDRRSQETYQAMLEAASKKGPFDAIIGAGNYTIGTNESGMITPECIEQWVCFMHYLSKYFQLVLLWAIGGHDVGYRYMVKARAGFAIGSEMGGMSEESVNMVEKHIGPLFQAKKIGPATFVTISTNLIKNVNDNSADSLKRLKLQQEEFLKEVLRTQTGVFLVMHDATALSREMRNLIIQNRSRIDAIIHGHNHSWLFRWITILTYPPYARLCLKVPMILADAPWGSFGVGKAFKVLEVDEEGSWTIKRYPL